MVSSFNKLTFIQKIIICSLMLLALVLFAVGSIIFTKVDQTIGLVLWAISISSFIIDSIIWVVIDSLERRRK